MKKLILDMYGVIIEESKGRFIPYTYKNLKEEEHERITQLFKKEKIFTRAQLGQLTSDEFLLELGFEKPDWHKKNYIKNHLTLDAGFREFADKNKGRFEFVLLSNDVLEWNAYIMECYQLQEYFTKVIVSGALGMKKPDSNIFEKALEILDVEPEDCIFIDNSVKNLIAAEKLGIRSVLFNRDGEEYTGVTVNNFRELDYLLLYYEE